MRYLFVLLSLLLCSNLLYAIQPDTLYFGSEGEKADVKEAVYFRPQVKKLPDGLYEIKDYHVSNGRLHAIGEAKDKEGRIYIGPYKSYYDDGSAEDEMFYDKKGRCQQRSLHYRKAIPTPAIVRNWKDDYWDGDLFGYHENGVINRTEVWKKGEFKSGKCFTHTGADTAYYPLKCCAEYPGGDRAYREYISKNRKYPPACQNNIGGTVYMHVIFDKTGKVTQVDVTDPVHPLLAAEAKRLMFNMPSWGEQVVDYSGRPRKYDNYLSVDFEPVTFGAFFIDPVSYIGHFFIR